MAKFTHDSFIDPTATRMVSRAEILAAFSYALDITEGQPEGHCVRACWIACQIANKLGLAEEEYSDLYYTVLLKDLGCSSNAARICELYKTDDRSFKREFKFVTGDLGDVLKFVFSHTGRDLSLMKRPRAILDILKNGPEYSRQLIETRCNRGAEIAKALRFSDAVADGIRSLDEHWDGEGKPQRLSGDDIPLFARVALLAQVAEVFHYSAGPEAALEEVRSHAGTWFDPALVDIFERVQVRAGFWETVASSDIELQLFALEPASSTLVVDEDYLDAIAFAFGEVVDAKSPYTAGHSSRVADYVRRIAEELDYPEERRGWLVRGALLHDIGKLGVSNSILDKPAKLDDEEWTVMRDHAAHTQTILGRISAFDDMAPISAAHHERLDGKGYPLGLDETTISLETRIISVCDFYDALTADRPYRAAMPVDKALGIMVEEVGGAIDADCFAALVKIVSEEGEAVASG